MPSPPTQTGTSGRTMPRSLSALLSSRSANRTASAITPMNATFCTSSEATITAPRPTPTAVAAGRLRPALPVALGSATGCSLRFRAATGSATGCSPCPFTAFAISPPTFPLRSLGTILALDRRRRKATPSPRSHLEQFGFLVLEQLVDLRGVLRGQVVELLLRAPPVVLADLAVLDQLVDGLLGMPPDAAHRDLGVLALGLGQLDVVPAALLGQLREDHPDQVAVVGRVDAQVRIADGLLHRGQRGLVVGRDHGHPGLRRLDRGHLRNRRHRAVVVHHDLVEHGRGRPAGADAGEVLLGHGYGLVHLLLGLEEGLVDHHGSLHPGSTYGAKPKLLQGTRYCASTSSTRHTRVPIFSPVTARPMLPSVSSSNASSG